MEMVRTPDGHSKLELIRFRNPPAVNGEPNAPANMLGTRRLMCYIRGPEGIIVGLAEHLAIVTLPLP